MNAGPLPGAAAEGASMVVPPAPSSEPGPVPSSGGLDHDTAIHRFASQFAAEWLALLFGLAIAGALIATALYRAHQSVDLTERDRLRVQSRVIDENVGQQLDGINKALANVRDEAMAMPPGDIARVMSARLRSLSDAIPGVRSMVLLDSGGKVAASSVEQLIGRDFSDRDYFIAPRDSPSNTTLYVGSPYTTSLGNITVLFARTVGGGRSNGFAGAAVAALEPEYFEVLMRSVLYAPDMWVSLGHGDGKIFVTMPKDAARLENDDWQRAAAAVESRSASAADTAIVVGRIGGTGEVRMTALRRIEHEDLHMDKPLVVTVSRASPEVFRAWRQQVVEYSIFFCLLSALAALGLYRGQWRRRSFAMLEASAEIERRKSAELLQLALDGARLGLWDWNVRDDRFNHNDFVVSQLGYPHADFARNGDSWRSLVHPDDAGRLIAAIETHFRAETPAYECEFRVRHHDGRWVWLLSRGKVVERDAFDTPVRMTGTHMDLTLRKQAEAEIERSAEVLRRTGELAKIGGWSFDLESGTIEWSEQVCRIHEVEPDYRPTVEPSFDFYAPEARPLIRDAVAAAMRDGTAWDLELPFVTARGTARWVRTRGVAVYAHGKPARLLGALQDITEKKMIDLEMHRLNEQLTRLSTTDSLTEVGNRRLFDQMLRAEWQRAARRGEAVALLMIDIDHFKDYNDHYGHPAGDACLRQVARMVGESVRRGGELVARYGGEEFALLLPGADLEAARAVAERCRQQIEAAKIQHRASATSAWLTVSIGVASQNASPDVDCFNLVEIADAALYRAKRCGRDRIES